MSFGPTGTSFLTAEQTNFLEKEFTNPLYNALRYRMVAEKEVFSAQIGETLTKTKVGLVVPNITPLNPSSNTNLDNGLTAQQYGVEQYTLTVNQYPQLMPDINLLNDQVTIDSFMMKNTFNSGIAIATAVDNIARNNLFAAYLAENTYVTATLGAPGTSIAVDDITGFQTVIVAGVVTPISGSHTLPVYVNGTLYQISSYTVDGSNVSTKPNGVSGTLVATGNISIQNGTLGNAVIGSDAPVVVRPSARATTLALTSADTLTMQSIFSARDLLKNNNVPMIDGAYHCYLNSTSMSQLMQDTQFQSLNRGVGVGASTYQKGVIVTEFLNIRFIETTQTFVSSNYAATAGAITVQRPIICGAGALVEGDFVAGMDAIKNLMGNTGEQSAFIMPISGSAYGMGMMPGMFDNFFAYMRRPLDRLGQIISQTSNWVGGFTVPTDVTTTSSIVPTASNARYKRAVVIETA